MSIPPPEEEEERAAQRARELAETIKQEAGAVSETVKDEAGGITDSAERRAAKLAQKVEEEAAAVTERVEERAKALEERRVEQRVEERGEQRSDLRDELHDIAVAIGVLVEHMDQSLPEERVKQLAEAVLAEERLGRKRLTTKIVGFMVVIVLLVASSLAQTAANGRTLSEAKTVADYVRDCLQHPERLSAEQRTERCGAQSGSPGAVLAIIEFQKCALQILPEDRTDQNMDACVASAVKLLTPTTPTTPTTVSPPG